MKISIAKKWNKKKFGGRNKLSETASNFLTQSFVMNWLCQNFHPSWWGECLWEPVMSEEERWVTGPEKALQVFLRIAL